MTKKTAHSQITKNQIYRVVASSTAIEIGVSVQKNCAATQKKIKHRRKPWASPVSLARCRSPAALLGCSTLRQPPELP